jgi:hypothetical protein
MFLFCDLEIYSLELWLSFQFGDECLKHLTEVILFI